MSKKIREFFCKQREKVQEIMLLNLWQIYSLMSVTTYVHSLRIISASLLLLHTTIFFKSNCEFNKSKIQVDFFLLCHADFTYERSIYVFY